MTTDALRHQTTTHATDTPGPGSWYRAICTCGWTSGLNGRRAAAQAAGRDHANVKNGAR